MAGETASLLRATVIMSYQLRWGMPEATPQGGDDDVSEKGLWACLSTFTLI